MFNLISQRIQLSDFASSKSLAYMTKVKEMLILEIKLVLRKYLQGYTEITRLSKKNAC